MTIGIVNVGIGNIGSLTGALYSLGWDTRDVRSSEDFEGIDRLILPGVGSFAEAMNRLQHTEIASLLKEFATSGKPVLGICLGMQLLATRGFEGGLNEGLGLVPGEVCLLDIKKNYRLPHVGWNSLEVSVKHPLLKGIRQNVDFYFVHSYYFRAENESHIIGTTPYGFSFPSIVAKANVVGTQFHPEKSQRSGLQLLDNFCTWDGVC
jgi:glutamine amidotransferase